MKKIILMTAILSLAQCVFAQKIESIKIKRAVLEDKIKGGWAGQTIGVTFGGPYEFRFNGTFIGDYQPLKWYDGYLKKTMVDIPGLYDDLYMDLTFVDVFEKKGMDAPVDDFANAYAHAGYALWHANQVGRYNILNGIKAPESGHWLNNPHADCIDYQIEADFAGLMSPAMPNTASAISDKIGHIMNYGDGWYGGVFVGAMYSLTFTSNDIDFVVSEGLKTIPTQSSFHQCISDVIGWHKKYPNDWKQTWLEVQKKWANDVGCPDGVFVPFNIDATVNAAYVVIGLLYGQGDFTKSLEISTRCGQDADCNPSTVGGILGAMLGYDKIPAYWKLGLKEAEDIDFKYTTMSLNDVYKIGVKHAIQNIEKNGGTEKDGIITIAAQQPVPVKFEKNFDGHYPLAKLPLNLSVDNEFNFEFDGIGFVIKGGTTKRDSEKETFVFATELYIDGKLVEKPTLPANFTTRKTDLAWKYQLPKGKHSVKLKIINSTAEYKISNAEAIVYTDKPVNGMEMNVNAAK
jgi:hypothetical protein